MVYCNTPTLSYGENSIDEVHDSAGTEFLKTEYENITVYYGYLENENQMITGFL